MIRPYAGTQGKSKILNYLSLAVSDTSKLVTSKMAAPETVVPSLKRKKLLSPTASPMKLVANGIAEYAIDEPPNAVTGTCALTAVESTHEQNF